MTVSTAFIMYSQGSKLLLNVVIDITISGGFPIWVIVQGVVLLILGIIYLVNKTKPPKITWPL